MEGAQRDYQIMELQVGQAAFIPASCSTLFVVTLPFFSSTCHYLRGAAFLLRPHTCPSVTLQGQLRKKEALVDRLRAQLTRAETKYRSSINALTPGAAPLQPLVCIRLCPLSSCLPGAAALPCTSTELLASLCCYMYLCRPQGWPALAVERFAISYGGWRPAAAGLAFCQHWRGGCTSRGGRSTAAAAGKL